MRLPIMVAALLLSGCWEGPLFYSAADAVQVLEPGRYEFRGPDEVEQFRVVESQDGMTVLQEGERSERYGLAPVDPGGGRFVGWSEPDADDAPGAPVVYVLVQRLRPGEYLYYHPFCDGRDAEVAAEAGAETIADGALTSCRFGSRAELERAMRRLVPQPERSATVVRVSDGPR